MEVKMHGLLNMMTVYFFRLGVFLSGRQTRQKGSMPVGALQ